MIDIDVVNNTATVGFDVQPSAAVIDVDVKEKGSATVDFNIQTSVAVIDIDIKKRDIGVPYTGTYDVTPLPFAEQELRTANRVMAQNVIIHEIPYYETSNPKGKTIVIGE